MQDRRFSARVVAEEYQQEARGSLPIPLLPLHGVSGTPVGCGADESFRHAPSVTLTFPGLRSGDGDRPSRDATLRPNESSVDVEVGRWVNASGVHCSVGCDWCW